MGEILSLRLAAETRLLNPCYQGFQLSLHRLRRPTAGQPELLRRILLQQPLLQIRLPSPWHWRRRDPPHGYLHPIAEVEQTLARAVTLFQTTGALADQTELILFAHIGNAGIKLAESRPPPANQHQRQHHQATAAAANTRNKP